MNHLAHYELLSKIASGGMAEIWLARLRTGEVCVVKKLLPQHREDEDFTRMFLEEGRLGSLFAHPNVVRMFDVGTAEGVHYLAMEYLHGEDLRVVNRLNRNAGTLLPLALTLDVVSRACAGLHYAHELKSADGTPLQLVHRDVSPHNVVLTFDGGVKIVDFGIAKSVGRHWQTKHGTLKGKVPYMAPEQIKARHLDRRTDVYAMGVMLYELVCGQRPYVVTARGDFALMMAIARHDIRPPRELVPNLDVELENLLQKALAYDPKDRWQTMQEMATALDTFGASRGLARGARPLAVYLATHFAARIEAWNATQPRDLAAHAVQVEVERAATGLYVEHDSDPSGTDAGDAATSAMDARPSAASLVAGSNSSAVASVVEVADTTVVTLRGRIDEGFEGAKVGAGLHGRVLFDLKAVERVTSFGVREWLEMMANIEDAEVWLARCSEAVVTQMALIRTFVGRARLVSFHAPFLCDDCGNAFSWTLDCEHDEGWFREGRGRAPRCARCGGSTKLDDDPAFLAFAASHAGTAVPGSLRVLLDTLKEGDRAEADLVEKSVTDTETRVRVLREIDGAVRWNRVFAGIEGRLVLDFHGLARVSNEGATNLVRALRALGREVTAIDIAECPAALMTALGDRPENDRPRLLSVAFTGRCTACAATRTGVVGFAKVVRATESGVLPVIPCRRCNAALQVEESAPSFSSLSSLSVVETSAPVSSPNVAFVAPAPARPTRRLPWALLAVASFVGLGVALGVIGALYMRRASPQAKAVAPVASGSTSVVVSAAAVDLMIVTPGTTNDADVARARRAAIVLAVREMAEALPADVRAANAAAPSLTDDTEIAERFTRDVGVFAGPERTSMTVSASIIRASYRIERAGWDRALGFYGETREGLGLVVARALPTHRDGLVVVGAKAKDPTLSPGAVLTTLDSHAVRATDGLELLARSPSRTHAAVFAVGLDTLSLTLR